MEGVVGKAGKAGKAGRRGLPEDVRANIDLF